VTVSLNKLKHKLIKSGRMTYTRNRYYILLMAQQPLVGQGLLIFEAPR